MDRFSLRYAYRRLTRRLVVLYVAQVCISLVAVVACAVLTAQQFRTVTGLPARLTLGEQLSWTFTLRFLPSGGNVLMVYLVLMASAYVVLPMLRANAWIAVLGGSIAAYVISQCSDVSWTTVHTYPGHGPVQNWLAWQVLFVPAMVIGWKWTDWRVPQRLDAALGYLLVTSAVLWAVLKHGQRVGDWLYAEPSLTDKVDLGAVRVFTAWLVIPTVYGVFRRLLQWARRDWLRPLVLVGARSLDSYVIQAVALIAIPTWIVMRPWNQSLSTVIVLTVFGICWGWALCRERLRIDRLHRLPLILSEAARNTPSRRIHA
ncbi:MAG: OpgC domain-containing protein [Gordonia sp. (in: high G+C Gram-positive bacteria)]